MAWNIAPYVLKVTGVAGVDLTGSQYLFVKQTGVGPTGTPVIAPCSAVTDVPLGVLQNAPASGDEAEVVVIGGTKIKASAAFAINAVLGTDAAGKAKALTVGTDTTAYSVGRALNAAAGANEITTAVVDCAAPGRAA